MNPASHTEFRTGPSAAKESDDLLQREALRTVAGSAADILKAMDTLNRWQSLRADNDGIRLTHRQPARLLRRLFHTRMTILTSGTLSVRDKDADFRSFRYDLGLFEGIHPISTRIEPKRHGTLAIVLAERSLPTPKHDDPLRDEWLTYVAHGIAAAHAEGGEVLVLTTNYADTGAIGEELVDLGVPCSVHSRGQRLGDLLLHRPQGTVFVTPAGWEGLDSAGGWQHLVVPRIPYPPRDNAADDDEFSFLNSQEVAMRRLRQALGRALRNPNDASTLWILDPRFPVPAEMMRAGHATQQKATGHLALAEAIPERFRRSGIKRSAWESATILKR